MQRCDYTPEYKPGRELVLPDMLPRAPLPETTDNKMEEEIALHVHLIQSILQVSKPRLEEIREETAKDESLKDLSEIIKRRWPETTACLSNSTHMYWDYREVLSELNGIILRGVILTSMRKEMLERTHQGKAWDEFWNSGKDFNMLYMPTTPKANAKEPMIPSQLPSKPWEKVATDLFTWDKWEYLIIVDYHSRFFEEAKMPDTKSNTVITHIKSAFARHGTPCQVISDNDPQYSSKEFESFTKQWQFKHTIISPLYPQANGLVEKSVQTVKNLLTKAKQDNRDPYLGLLEHTYWCGRLTSAFSQE